MDCIPKVQKFRLNRLQYHMTMPYGPSSLVQTTRCTEMFVAMHEINVWACVCGNVRVCASRVQSHTHTSAEGFSKEQDKVQWSDEGMVNSLSRQKIEQLCFLVCQTWTWHLETAVLTSVQLYNDMIGATAGATRSRLTTADTCSIRLGCYTFTFNRLSHGWWLLDQRRSNSTRWGSVDSRAGFNIIVL